MALTADRHTPVRAAEDFEFPVAAGALIFTGALVVLSGALAQPGTAALNLVAVGRAEARADNSAGANGDIRVKVRRGCFRFANSAAADEITIADVGAKAFIVDDETVAKTNGGATRSEAGTIRDVDAQGVWIEI